MVRAGQFSSKAALICQHFDEERQEEVAAGLDATVRKAREGAAQKAAEKRSGTDPARGEWVGQSRHGWMRAVLEPATGVHADA
jgi:hypothetical protein